MHVYFVLRYLPLLSHVSPLAPADLLSLPKQLRFQAFKRNLKAPHARENTHYRVLWICIISLNPVKQDSPIFLQMWFSSSL